MTQSLRDRQRLRVRRDIQDAAWQLFIERGFASVTTDEIAAAAGVSPSTYYRHVATKEDLLLYPVGASSAEIVRRFSEWDSDVPAAMALGEVIVEVTAAAQDAPMRQWRAALTSAPELLSRVTLIRDDDRRALVEIAAERMGVDADDMRPGVVVSVVLAAAEYAYRRWLQDDATPLAKVIGDVVGYAVGSFKSA